MKHGKLIGVGNTANIYEWEEGKVLKLFKQGYPIEAIEMEYHNAMAIAAMEFAKPRAYEIITYEESKGIIYDRIEGESLLDWVLKTGDLQGCAEYMAKLHKDIVRNNISSVPNYRDFLKYHISKSALSSDDQKEALRKLERLPDGNVLCHGDFHPGNIIVSGEAAYIIDFMNICRGVMLYDVARTVYLVEYTPVPPEVNDRDAVLLFKKTLADLYLLQMKVTREMIQDYLEVIITARQGECPGEA